MGSAWLQGLQITWACMAMEHVRLLGLATSARDYQRLLIFQLYDWKEEARSFLCGVATMQNQSATTHAKAKQG